jgi:hypothetical protein
MSYMTKAPKRNLVDELLTPLGGCLNRESARKIAALKAPAKLQVQMDHLAERHTAGELSPSEAAEYGRYVSYSTFIAILKSKARQLLASQVNA